MPPKLNETLEPELFECGFEQPETISEISTCRVGGRDYFDNDDCGNDDYDNDHCDNDDFDNEFNANIESLNKDLNVKCDEMDVIDQLLAENELRIAKLDAELDKFLTLGEETIKDITDSENLDLLLNPSIQNTVLKIYNDAGIAILSDDDDCMQQPTKATSKCQIKKNRPFVQSPVYEQQQPMVKIFNTKPDVSRGPEDCGGHHLARGIEKCAHKKEQPLPLKKRPHMQANVCKPQPDQLYKCNETGSSSYDESLGGDSGEVCELYTSPRSFSPICTPSVQRPQNRKCAPPISKALPKNLQHVPTNSLQQQKPALPSRDVDNTCIEKCKHNFGNRDASPSNTIPPNMSSIAPPKRRVCNPPPCKNIHDGRIDDRSGGVTKYMNRPRSPHPLCKATQNILNASPQCLSTVSHNDCRAILKPATNSLPHPPHNRPRSPHPICKAPQPNILNAPSTVPHNDCKPPKFSLPHPPQNRPRLPHPICKAPQQNNLNAPPQCLSTIPHNDCGAILKPSTFTECIAECEKTTGKPSTKEHIPKKPNLFSRIVNGKRCFPNISEIPTKDQTLYMTERDAYFLFCQQTVDNGNYRTFLECPNEFEEFFYKYINGMSYNDIPICPPKVATEAAFTKLDKIVLDPSLRRNVVDLALDHADQDPEVIALLMNERVPLWVDPLTMSELVTPYPLHRQLYATDVRVTAPGSIAPKTIPVEALNMINTHVMGRVEAILKSNEYLDPNSDKVMEEIGNVNVIKPEKNDNQDGSIPKDNYKCSIDLHPFRVQTFFQLRGANVPLWYPGMYTAFPDGRSSVKLVSTPSALITTAWRLCAP